jgi:hypothetical protein
MKAVSGKSGPVLIERWIYIHIIDQREAFWGLVGLDVRKHGGQNSRKVQFRENSFKRYISKRAGEGMP